MSDKQVKILTNVFLSTNGNQLKIVDIQFSDRIDKIIFRLLFFRFGAEKSFNSFLIAKTLIND